MSRRRAFTLVEVVVALVLSAVVVTLAYSVLQAGTASQERFALHRQRIDDEVALRTLISSALRHAEHGSLGGRDVFSVGRDNGERVLTFLSRGIIEPYGTGPAWTVILGLKGDTLLFFAQPADDSAFPVSGALNDVTNLEFRMLARGSFSTWSSEWPQSSIAPQAVSITYDRVGSAPVPLVARLGLERIP